MRVQRILRGCGVLLAAAVSTVAFAADFPTKPVRIIVPSAPGGSLDLTTRLVAQKLSENLGQPVIVDNRAGGDNLVGIRAAKDAPADGYTITAQANGFSLIPFIKEDPGYDPLKDFTPIGFMTRSPFVMEVGSDQPDKTLGDFIARAKAAPGKLAYASAGVGTPPHIAAAEFFSKAGLNVTHIPYKGNGAALPDVAGGRVQAIFDGFISSRAYLKGDKLRPLAVTSPTRIAALPDVPTFKEQGIDYTYTLWLGLLAPAATPPAVVARLSEALRAATGSPELSERFKAEGSDPTFVAPAEFGAYLKTEVAEMQKLVVDLNLPKQ